jgi:hypothetical protein
MDRQTLEKHIDESGIDRDAIQPFVELANRFEDNLLQSGLCAGELRVLLAEKMRRPEPVETDVPPREPDLRQLPIDPVV